MMSGMSRPYARALAVAPTALGSGEHRPASPNELLVRVCLGHGQRDGGRQEQHADAVTLQCSGLDHGGGQQARLDGDLAEALNDSDSLRILPIAGIGGPRNIRDVSNVMGIDIGLTQTDILNNLRRSNERMGQVEERLQPVLRCHGDDTYRP